MQSINIANFGTKKTSKFLLPLCGMCSQDVFRLEVFFIYKIRPCLQGDRVKIARVYKQNDTGRVSPPPPPPPHKTAVKEASFPTYSTLSISLILISVSVRLGAPKSSGYKFAIRHRRSDNCKSASKPTLLNSHLDLYSLANFKSSSTLESDHVHFFFSGRFTFLRIENVSREALRFFPALSSRIRSLDIIFFA